jgi:hypothetical protein
VIGRRPARRLLVVAPGPIARLASGQLRVRCAAGHRGCPFGPALGAAPQAGGHLPGSPRGLFFNVVFALTAILALAGLLPAVCLSEWASSPARHPRCPPFARKRQDRRPGCAPGPCPRGSGATSFVLFAGLTSGAHGVLARPDHRVAHAHPPHRLARRVVLGLRVGQEAVLGADAPLAVEAVEDEVCQGPSLAGS